MQKLDKIRIDTVTKADFLAVFDGNVQEASKAMKVKPSTLYGWPEELNYRFQAAVVAVCKENGKAKKLRDVVEKRLQGKAAA